MISDQVKFTVNSCMGCVKWRGTKREALKMSGRQNGNDGTGTTENRKQRPGLAHKEHEYKRSHCDTRKVTDHSTDTNREEKRNGKRKAGAPTPQWRCDAKRR